MSSIEAADTGTPNVTAMVADLSNQFIGKFDPAYVKNVIVPHFLVSTYLGERLLFPMLDVRLSKQDAMSDDLWGLISETWRPSAENGATLFLQGLEKRGPDNRRKRIYMSAVTPDLYRPMYGDKVIGCRPIERFVDQASDLVRLKVDLIVASNTPAARAAQQATDTIPIVVCLLWATPSGTGSSPTSRGRASIPGLFRRSATYVDKIIKDAAALVAYGQAAPPISVRPFPAGLVRTAVMALFLS